jgi:hypothetical protein
MADKNIFQVKRTAIPGRTPNTTNSSNSTYITAGEFALNMSDQILYTSNGTSLITVGANVANLNVTSITANGFVGTDGQILVSNSTGKLYWADRFTVSDTASSPFTPNYGDVWFSTDDNKPYMWVNTGYFDTWYDFLPPTPGS